MTTQTTLDRAKEAYDKILSIKPSFDHLPTEQEEIAEHQRVYWERVNVIAEIMYAKN